MSADSARPARATFLLMLPGFGSSSLCRQAASAIYFAYEYGFWRQPHLLIEMRTKRCGSLLEPIPATNATLH